MHLLAMCACINYSTLWKDRAPMEALSPEQQCFISKVLLFLEKLPGQGGSYSGGAIPRCQGCLQPFWSFPPLPLNRRSFSSPKGGGEEDPTCSGTISEVLETGQPTGDFTAAGMSPMWSWQEGTAQELHWQPADTIGHRDLEALLQ